MKGHRPHDPPWEVYLDETLSRGAYDLIGGLWLSPSNARRLRDVVAGLRERYNYHYEFKWKKPSGDELSPVYRDLAQKITDQIWAGRAAFHCIAIRKNLVDYQTYHNGDYEEGYYKFAHFLVRKRAEIGKSYVVFMDRRTTRRDDPLGRLKDVLNACGRKDLGIHYDCCRDVQAQDSKKEEILQVVDVVLGAVGWHYAGSHRDPASSMAKNLLAARIAQGIRKPDLAFSSSRYESRFNIWRWAPGPQEGEK